METFNSIVHAEAMIKADTDSIENKKTLFQKCVDYFGIDALRPKTGLRGQAMQASAKPETKKKAANEVGLTVAQAEELTAMIAKINEHRVNVWQDYQRAYFGTPPKVTKEKTPEEIEIAAQKATRSKILAEKKALAEQVALIKAERTVLESQGKELPAERAAELERTENAKKILTDQSDALRDNIAGMVQQKGLPAQIKKVEDFRKAMAKFLGGSEDLVGQMSLNGILKKLKDAKPTGDHQWYDEDGNKVD